METFQLFAESLIPVISAFLMGLVPVVVLVIGHYLKKWAGVHITERQRYMLEDIARDAVAYAEEQARNAAACDVKPSSTLKMKYAMDFASEQMLELGIPQMTASALRNLIEAKLNNSRPEEGTRCKTLESLP
jgi:hypothetical protein